MKSLKVILCLVALVTLISLTQQAAEASPLKRGFLTNTKKVLVSPVKIFGGILFAGASIAEDAIDRAIQRELDKENAAKAAKEAPVAPVVEPKVEGA